MSNSLISIARRCRAVYLRAVRELGPELSGGSVLDLCADQIPEQPLETLKHAIVVSGIAGTAHPAIRQQIRQYSVSREAPS